MFNYKEICRYNDSNESEMLSLQKYVLSLSMNQTDDLEQNDNL